MSDGGSAPAAPGGQIPAKAVTAAAKNITGFLLGCGWTVSEAAEAAPQLADNVVAAAAPHIAAAERERWRFPVRDLLSLLNEVADHGFTHDDHPGPAWDLFGERHENLERKIAALLEAGRP